MKEQQLKPLLILCATQTGNALDAAERIGREAERRGGYVKLLSMDEYDAVRMVLVLALRFEGRGKKIGLI